MGYTEIIAREAETLSPEKQVELLDFIAFLKVRKTLPLVEPTLKTTNDIEAFFKSFNVDISDYHFDREDANAR